MVSEEDIIIQAQYVLHSLTRYLPRKRTLRAGLVLTKSSCFTETPFFHCLAICYLLVRSHFPASQGFNSSTTIMAATTPMADPVSLDTGGITLAQGVGAEPGCLDDETLQVQDEFLKLMMEDSKILRSDCSGGCLNALHAW